MNRTIVIVLVTLLLGIFVIVNAEEKEVVKKMEPPTLKEQVETLEKHISHAEAELNAQIDLSREALVAAKKQLDEAKKSVDTKGKETETETALYKARHYLHSVHGLGGMGGMADVNMKIIKLRKSMGTPGMSVMSISDDDEMPGMNDEKDIEVNIDPKDIQTQIGDLQKQIEDSGGKVKVKVMAK